MQRLIMHMLEEVVRLEISNPDMKNGWRFLFKLFKIE